jgi:hypothetical protein
MIIRSFIAITAFVVVAYILLRKTPRNAPQREIKPTLAILPAKKPSSIFGTGGKVQLPPEMANNPEWQARQKRNADLLKKNYIARKVFKLVEEAKANGYE